MTIGRIGCWLCAHRLVVRQPKRPFYHRVVGESDSCTMEHLVSLFRNIPAARQDEILCSRLSGLNLSRVRVAPSLITDAGRGLFAKRSIDAGEVVTLYPCDALLSWPSETPTREVTPSQGHSIDGNVRLSLGEHSDGMGLEGPGFDIKSESGATAWRYAVKMGPTRAVLANSNRIEDAACAYTRESTTQHAPIPHASHMHPTCIPHASHMHPTCIPHASHMHPTCIPHASHMEQAGLLATHRMSCHI
jgi:hypothetical protein